MKFFKSLFNKKDLPLTALLSNQSEDGWKDLVFTITDAAKSNGYFSLVCKAKYNDIIIGFKVKIADAMPAGIVNDEPDTSAFIEKGAVFTSIGDETEKLKEAVASLYGYPANAKFSATQIAFTLFPLNDTLARLEHGPFRFKAFFDDDNELGLYSELYLNIDLPNRILELNEKDHEYRQNIVSILAAL